MRARSHFGGTSCSCALCQPARWTAGLAWTHSVCAVVDVDAGVGSLATVYADRVRVMAQRAGVDNAELLGRAMAHEVGHLLLGTNGHAAHGLMRASWSSVDLQGYGVQWFFNGKEGEAMRRGIASRFRF